MANLLRMDLYRMFRSKVFWICLAVIVLMAIFETGMLWFATSDFLDNMLASGSASSGGLSINVVPNPGEAVSADGSDIFSSMSLLQFVSQVNLGIIPLLAVVFTAVFCAGEFDNGFAKNIFSMRQNRFDYFASKVVIMLIATVALLAVGTATSLVAVSVAGLDLAGSSLVDWAIWLSLATLVLMAYELLVSGMYWATRSKVATLIVSILVVVGVVGTVLTGFLNLVFPSFDLVQYLLYSCLSALNMESPTFEGFNSALIIGTGMVYALVGGAVGAGALIKRDV